MRQSKVALCFPHKSVKLLGEHCAFPLCAVIRGAGLCATVEGGDGGCDPEAEGGGGEHEREGELQGDRL